MLVGVYEYSSVSIVNRKTAYEIRISDCSSDVCSSDLSEVRRGASSTRHLESRIRDFSQVDLPTLRFELPGLLLHPRLRLLRHVIPHVLRDLHRTEQIGRESRRARVCQYV